MKRIKFLYLVVVLGIVAMVISCDNRENIKNEIGQLNNEKLLLVNEISDLNISKNRINTNIQLLNNELEELQIYKAGSIPKFIIKVQLKQSHFTLDLDKHFKDAMNTITFTLPVDKEFYNSVSVGTLIVDEFRVGSFIMNGDIGDWEIKVIEKKIQ